MEKLILHEDPISGNCYKIQLTAALLAISLERCAYDIRKGEARTPEFVATVNANGRIPASRSATASYPRATPPAGGSRLVHRSFQAIATRKPMS